MDHYTQTIWRSSGAAPQSLTVDLGTPRANIEMLTYLPPQVAPMQATQDTSGRIASYRISYSLDGATFTPVMLRAPSRRDLDLVRYGAGRLAVGSLHPVRACYVRLEALASGGIVQISELDVGGNSLTPN